MKKNLALTLIALLHFSTALAQNSNPNMMIPDAVTCTSESGLTIEFFHSWGELLVTDADGTVIHDHEDGFDTSMTVHMTLDGYHIKVFHHEETELTVLEYRFNERTDENYVGTYYGFWENLDEQVTCSESPLN